MRYPKIFYTIRKDYDAKFHPAPGEGKTFHPNRCLQRKPCWQKVTIAPQEEMKTLILADWTAPAWTNLRDDQIQHTLSQLLRDGFTIYVWQGEKHEPVLLTPDNLDQVKTLLLYMVQSLGDAPFTDEAMIKKVAKQYKLREETLHVVDDYWLEAIIKQSESLPRELDVTVHQDKLLLQNKVIYNRLKTVVPPVQAIVKTNYPEHFDSLSSYKKLRGEFPQVKEHCAYKKIATDISKLPLLLGQKTEQGQAIDTSQVETLNLSIHVSKPLDWTGVFSRLPALGELFLKGNENRHEAQWEIPDSLAEKVGTLSLNNFSLAKINPQSKFPKLSWLNLYQVNVGLQDLAFLLQSAHGLKLLDLNYVKVIKENERDKFPVRKENRMQGPAIKRLKIMNSPEFIQCVFDHINIQELEVINIESKISTAMHLENKIFPKLEVLKLKNIANLSSNSGLLTENITIIILNDCNLDQIKTPLNLPKLRSLSLSSCCLNKLNTVSFFKQTASLKEIVFEKVKFTNDGWLTGFENSTVNLSSLKTITFKDCNVPASFITFLLKNAPSLKRILFEKVSIEGAFDPAILPDLDLRSIEIKETEITRPQLTALLSKASALTEFSLQPSPNEDEQGWSKKFQGKINLLFLHSLDLQFIKVSASFLSALIENSKTLNDLSILGQFVDDFDAAQIKKTVIVENVDINLTKAGPDINNFFKYGAVQAKNLKLTNVDLRGSALGNQSLLEKLTLKHCSLSSVSDKLHLPALHILTLHYPSDKKTLKIDDLCNLLKSAPQLKKLTLKHFNKTLLENPKIVKLLETLRQRNVSVNIKYPNDDTSENVLDNLWNQWHYFKEQLAA